jgi:hypothetical protein
MGERLPRSYHEAPLVVSSANEGRPRQRGERYLGEVDLRGVLSNPPDALSRLIRPD